MVRDRMSDPWPPRPPDGRERRETPVPLEVPAGPKTPAIDGTDEAGPARRSSANRRALGITALVVVGFLAIVVVVGGPGAAPGSPTFPPAGATAAPAGSEALATRGDVAAALAAQGMHIEDVVSAYRPAEAPRLAVAPRIVVRAVIPTDPEHGRVVIYEFLDSAVATGAAREQAAYGACGVGRVQFPPQTQFSLRVVGSTVVFYAWSSTDSPDPGRLTAVATALATLGFEVPVPN